jgi:hypothetical protein
MSSEQTTSQTGVMVQPKSKKKLCCGAKLCKCKKIKTIQRCIRKWQENKNKLEPIAYMGDKITIYDINVFTNKNRSENDSNNKKRENIIACIINDKIPKQYYTRSSRWNNLKIEIAIFITELCIKKRICFENIECIHKAGRCHHYDFKIIINNSEEIMLEFKCNASCVNDTPQFVSPMKPSQYLESSYEKYYYNYYFRHLVNEYKLPLPTEEEYLKDIHSTNPTCLKNHQEKYYRGCKKSSKYSGEENDIKFYESSKKTSHDSIMNFISKYDIDKDKLTKYLLDTQKNKFYMLYKDGKLYLETINLNDYIITEITKDPEKNRYMAKTKSDRNLKILLRWKNGNGIAFPSFQIS